MFEIAPRHGGASAYEDHAFAQRHAAADLLAFTRAFAPRAPAAILEPGCGTGLYTRLLAAAFPAARIDAVDLSEAMLAEALRRPWPRTVRFRRGDATAPPAGAVDLVTSSAAFQWFRDLPASLARLAAGLAPGGRLTFSFFGPGTYAELDAALREVLGPGAGVRARSFLGGDELATILGETLASPAVEERRYVETFPSLRALLLAIRRTGTRGDGAGPRIAWTPRTFAEVEATMRSRHGGEVRASYQVYLCGGAR